jgi:hypothetical protein
MNLKANISIYGEVQLLTFILNRRLNIDTDVFDENMTKQLLALNID